VLHITFSSLTSAPHIKIDVKRLGSVQRTLPQAYPSSYSVVLLSEMQGAFLVFTLSVGFSVVFNRLRSPSKSSEG